MLSFRDSEGFLTSEGFPRIFSSLTSIGCTKPLDDLTTAHLGVFPPCCAVNRAIPKKPHKYDHESGQIKRLAKSIKQQSQAAAAPKRLVC